MRKGYSPKFKVDPQAVHTALEATVTTERPFGSVTEAAAALGIPAITIYKTIASHPEMKARWTKNPTIALPDPESLAIAAVQRTDAAMRESFSAVFPAAALDQAIKIQRMAGKQIRGCMEYMAGDLFQQYVNLGVQIEAINTRMADTTKLMTAELEEMLRDDRAVLHEHQLAIYDRLHKAQVAAVLAQAKLSGNNGKPAAQKPAFGPLMKRGRVETPPPTDV